MPVKIVARPPRRRPCPGRRPDPGPKSCNASPRYFISRANDFSEHRRRVDRPAHAARRTLAVTHAIVSNEPRGPCSLPLSSLPLRTPAEGHGGRRRGSGRPTGPPRSAREQGQQRPAGWSQVDPMAGLPSGKGNIPAPGLRAHSHRSTGRRHSGSPPVSCLVSRLYSLYLISKRLPLIHPGSLPSRLSGLSPARIPGCAVPGRKLRLIPEKNDFLEHLIQIGSWA
jgi:hypothetical protein